MPANHQPEAVIEPVGNLGSFRLLQVSDGKSEVGIGTGDHSMTSCGIGCESASAIKRCLPHGMGVVINFSLNLLEFLKTSDQGQLREQPIRPTDH